MPRDLPLSNGSFLVAFDRDYRIRDLYFPHVGSENHAAGHAFRFGAWVDGRFAWVDEGWEKDLRFLDPTLVTDVVLGHAGLGLTLRCADAVDFYENLLVRRVEVVNEADTAREVRLFWHHDFRIKGNEVGDTAFYSPDLRCIVHYKDDRYFLANVLAAGQAGAHQFATGQKHSGAEGTWRDAEDGSLQGNPIAQGAVDSTLGVGVRVEAGGSQVVYYWLAAGTNFREVEQLDALVRDKTPSELLRRTANYWQLWVGRDRRGTADLPQQLVDRYRQSLLIIRSQIDDDGAVMAANDTDITHFARDTYSYLWPRDGALVSVALMRAGQTGAPVKFLEFCSRVISPLGYMRHKYTPSGDLASSWHGYVRDGKPVLPIQEDETALVTWALWQYFEQFRRVEETAPFYRSLVTRPADFMLSYVDPATGLPLPSHDLWEERWGVHAFTVASVIAGLRAAARVSHAFGEEERAGRYHAGAERMHEALRAVLWNPAEGRFARMATPREGGGYDLDMTLDSALFGLVEFGALEPDDPQAVSTFTQIEERLWVHTDIGGLARYANDYYQQVEKTDLKAVPGNPWFISTLWLARWHALKARNPRECHRARELLEWAASRALPSGVMAEQLHPYTGEPLSVSPLTWSHAAYVRTARDYVDKAYLFNLCPTCGQTTARAPRPTEKLSAVHE